MKRIYLFLFLGILLLAFLLRFKLFAYGDFYFFQDQSRDLLLVKQVAEQGKIILIGARTGFGGIFHGPLWIYALVPTFLLSHGNPYFSLVPMFLIVSLGIVLLGYLAGKSLYGNALGLIFAFFLAVSLPLNESIYFMTNAQAAPIFVIPFVYFLIRYLRGEEKWIIASSFLLGICIDFEAAFSFSLVAVLLIAVLVRRRIKLKTAFLSLMAFFVSISNYILFEFRHGFLMTKSFERLLKGQGGVLPGYEEYQNIFFRIHDRLLGFLSTFVTPFYSPNNLIKLMVLVIITFVGLELFKKFRQGKLSIENKELIFLVSMPAISYVLYVFYPYPLWGHYILPLTIPSILAFSLGLKMLLNKNYGKFFVMFIILISLISPIYSIYSYYLTPKSYTLLSDSSYKNQLAVAKWILNDSSGKPFNYLVYIPSTLTYGMDYLFSWRNLIGNRAIIPCSKNGLTYVIYYPHLKGDNNATVFWKKNVIKINQSAQEAKNFPGNIKVEKYDKPDGGAIDPNYCQNLIFR